MSSSYYDIDAILSEEELVPCWTNFDFSYLATLDPDHHHHHDGAAFLPEACKLKMPVWALAKWGPLGYVKMVLPRHYGRKAREKLQADACQVDLSKRNQHYFGTGFALMELWEQCREKLSAQQVPRNKRRQWQQQLDQLRAQVRELRTSLVAAYTGERLRRTMDWSWSAVADDVSALTDQLTVWELRLFDAGAMAVQQWDAWQQQGKRRSIGSNGSSKRRVISPEPSQNGEQIVEGEEVSPSKRSRLG